MNKKRIIILSLAIIFIIAGLFYYNYKVKKAYDYSRFFVEEIVTNDTSNSTESKEPKKILSLELLKQRNPDVIGIVHFNDEIIYEPIVQATDNQYYERKNIDKKYAAAGISFVSADSNIQAQNVVVYGHSSKSKDIIFTPLMNYLDYDYYKDNSTFLFETASGIRTYKIFAVIVYDTNNLDDSLEFTQSSWRRPEEFDAFIAKVKEESFYQTNVNVAAENKIMTLVTCDTRNGNKRIIVLSKLIKNGDQ